MARIGDGVPWHSMAVLAAVGWGTGWLKGIDRGGSTTVESRMRCYEREEMDLI
jgi:hypothetical protein